MRYQILKGSPLFCFFLSPNNLPQSQRSLAMNACRESRNEAPFPALYEKLLDSCSSRVTSGLRSPYPLRILADTRAGHGVLAKYKNPYSHWCWETGMTWSILWLDDRLNCLGVRFSAGGHRFFCSLERSNCLWSTPSDQSVTAFFHGSG
jgi:hypothetical protein